MPYQPHNTKSGRSKPCSKDGVSIPEREPLLAVEPGIETTAEKPTDSDDLSTSAAVADLEGNGGLDELSATDDVGGDDSTAPDPVQTDPVPPWLEEVAIRWDKTAGTDLALRHETGRHLNTTIGEPGKRQPRGKAVVEMVASRLCISASEISRMRAFAAQFPTFEEFCARHTGVNSWSAVKPLLTARKGSRSVSRTQPAQLQGIIRTILKLRETLRGLQSYCPSNKGRTPFRHALVNFAKAIPPGFGTKMEVKQVEIAREERTVGGCKLFITASGNVVPDEELPDEELPDEVSD